MNRLQRKLMVRLSPGDPLGRANGNGKCGTPPPPASYRHVPLWRFTTNAPQPGGYANERAFDVAVTVAR
ncbi:hypothetical protein DPEC_G00377070 [Dallia pectoralis]|nr:hypothetical protein DPEC_G00377070 [Dallia pectoralis]